MARTVGIWVSGLIAGAIFGAFIGQALDASSMGDPGVPGAIGGMCLFICARLWATSRAERAGDFK